MAGKPQNTDLGALHLRVNSNACAHMIAEKIEALINECRRLEVSTDPRSGYDLMLNRATILALRLLLKAGGDGMFATALQMQMVRKWGRPMSHRFQRKVMYRVVVILAEARDAAKRRTLRPDTKTG